MSMNRQEIQAAVEVLNQLADLLYPITAHPADNRRLAIAQVTIESLAVELNQSAKHLRVVRDGPLRDFRRQAERVRTRMAELKADRTGAV